jgi:hypothetical protein
MKLSFCWRSALFQRQRKPDEHVDEEAEWFEVAGLQVVGVARTDGSLMSTSAQLC